MAEPQSKSHIAPQELTSHRIDASVGIQDEKQVVRKTQFLLQANFSAGVLGSVRAPDLSSVRHRGIFLI